MNEITKQRMEKYGNRERYCIDQLFTKLTSKSTKYNYKVYHTDSSKSIGYESMVAITDKLTGELLQWYMVEAKVREQMFDDWFLEEKKLNTLKREKQKLYDQKFISTDTSILYINFTLENTLIWFIEDMDLGEMKRLKMNKVTAAKNNKKIYKNVYNLKPEDGKIIDWSYNGNHHLEELKQEERIIKEQISGIGNWLFGQKIKISLEEYKNNNKQ